MKKSEKRAKEALRNVHRHDVNGVAPDHVPVVTRRGGGMQYNEGQAVSQGLGSGIRDIMAARRAAKARKGK